MIFNSKSKYTKMSLWILLKALFLKFYYNITNCSTKEKFIGKRITKFFRRQFYWSSIRHRLYILISAWLIIFLGLISPLGVKPAKAVEPVTLTLAAFASLEMGLCAIGMAESWVVWYIKHGGWLEDVSHNPDFVTSLGIGCFVSALFFWAKIPVVHGWLAEVLHLGAEVGISELAEAAYHKWGEAVIPILIENWWLLVKANTNPTLFWAQALLVEESEESQLLYDLWYAIGEAYQNDTGEDLVKLTIVPPEVVKIIEPTTGTLYNLDIIDAKVVYSDDMIFCDDPDTGRESDVAYVQFGYSFTSIPDDIEPLPSQNTSTEGKDYYGCNGWGLDFDIKATGIAEPTPMYLAARVEDSYGTLTPWEFSDQLIVDPRSKHDYSVTNIQFSPTSPNEDDTVQVTATVTNLGASNESNVRVEFDVDDRFNNSHYIQPLAAGASTTTSFTWQATQGAHTFTMSAGLPTDKNRANDSTTKTLVVGTAPLIQVNGSSSPASFQVSASTNGTTSNFSALIQNVGTADTTVSVSKGGAKASWITLSSPTSFAVAANRASPYSYSVNVPSGQATGTYSAEIYFDWVGGTRIVLPIDFDVKQYALGNVNENLSPSSGTVNGASAGVLTRGSKSNITLDNYTSTADPINISDTFNLSDSEYYRIPSDSGSEWAVNISENQSESSNTGMYFELSGFETTQVNSYNGSFSIFPQIVRGGNSFFIGLSDVLTYGNNTTWVINSSQFNFKQNNSAWWDTDGYIPGDSAINAWKAGWDYARVCATVTAVSTSGDVTLFNGVESVSTKTITGSNVGSEVCWSVSPSKLYGANYFNLRARSNGANISLSNIHFIVHYYTGQPALQVTRSLSTQKASIDQTITATLTFTNNGSNIAENPSYTENLPAGLTLLSGSLSDSVSDVNPGNSTSATYTFRGNTPGTYTIPGRIINYTDPANNNFSSISNSTAFEVWGGTLQLIPDTVLDGEAGSPTTIATVVTDSLTGNPVMDATVIATITQPDNSSIEIVLPWDTAASKYVTHFAPSTGGAHTISMTANRLFYTPGSSPGINWPVTLQNQEPIAHSSYQVTSDGEPFGAYLDGSSTLDVDGIIQSYAWDTNQDGNTDITGRKVEWTFPGEGTYPVTLTVTDDKGVTSQTSMNVAVSEDVLLTRNFTFTTGWNLIGLAVNNNSFTAESLCQNVIASGVQVNEIDRWYAGGWDSHICGLPFNDFTIDLGKGYFIRSGGTGNSSYTGTAHHGQFTIQLSAGWNLIALPEGVTYNAESLLGMAGGACNEIDRWYAGGWDSHIYTLPFNNFSIESGQAYFIKCSQQASLSFSYP